MQGKDSACLYYAMKHAPKGSVLVIDHTGDQTYACVDVYKRQPQWSTVYREGCSFYDPEGENNLHQCIHL